MHKNAFALIDDRIFFGCAAMAQSASEAFSSPQNGPKITVSQQQAALLRGEK